MHGTALNVDGVSKAFGNTPVLSSIHLDVPDGAFVSLLGPSGCGKTTLLRIVAGFEVQDRGAVRIAGTAVDTLPPKARRLAMVFQSYALYPHMTVAENISMPLVMERLSTIQRLPVIGRFWPGARAITADIEARVRQVADLVEIGRLLDRRPGALSGGQRQRVALARAIVREPALFLMDEPLSNLDARLRVQMRSELVALNRRLGATVLYVTHDQTEAMTMSDRIALMMNGEIRQYATPAEIYRKPAHLDVATFIGQPPINQFAGSTDASGRVLVPEATTVSLIAQPGLAGLTVAVRPEAFVVRGTARTEGIAATFQARLERSELLGAEVLLWCRTANSGHPLVMQMNAAAFDALKQVAGLDDTLTLDAVENGIHVFGTDGSALGALTISNQSPGVRQVRG